MPYIFTIVIHQLNLLRSAISSIRLFAKEQRHKNVTYFALFATQNIMLVSGVAVSSA
jgi:hypothetical protein